MTNDEFILGLLAVGAQKTQYREDRALFYCNSILVFQENTMNHFLVRAPGRYYFSFLFSGYERYYISDETYHLVKEYFENVDYEDLKKKLLVDLRSKKIYKIESEDQI